MKTLYGHTKILVVSTLVTTPTRWERYWTEERVAGARLVISTLIFWGLVFHFVLT
jgi:hypothetical protein